jgi:hypothetical protein
MGHGVSHSVDDPLVARLELIGSVVPRQADDLLPCDVESVDGDDGGVDDERVMLVLSEVGVCARYSSRTRSSVLPSSRSSPRPRWPAGLFFFAMCSPWDSEAGGMPFASFDGALARIILRRPADHFG